MKPTYLDYSATAPMLPEVMLAMTEVMQKLARGELGNPAALHTPGQRAKQILDDARVAIADLINAEPAEIIFTSGGSEANNTVINIFADQPIAVSEIEHPSILEPAKTLASKLTLIPVDKYGVVKPWSPQETSPPRLVSVMLVNNELGTIEPISDLSSQAHRFSARFHTDATQAVGKIPVDVKALGVDYLTFSAHKLGGPVGIGALYVKKGAPYHPLIRGGHQESGRRAGTSNVLLAAGFAAAARHAAKTLPDYARVAKLRDDLARRILNTIPHSSINGSSTALPNILNVSFAAAEGESIQLYLDLANIVVSTGSACASGSLAPSHVIMATRHDAEVAHSSIRFSLGPATTKDDISKVMQELPRIIKRLQGISTIKLKTPAAERALQGE